MSDSLIDSIHARKEQLFEHFLETGLRPRDGVAACLEACRAKDIKLGFITTTSRKNIDLLATALQDSIDFSWFDLITTKDDVEKEKPNGAVYRYALTQFDIPPEAALAVEDTEANQEAALSEQILCYLFAGEYATTHHNLNAVKTLEALANRL